MSEGYVYFVACENAQYRLLNPYIKIGYTTNLLGRLKSIQTGSPVKLCFMGYIKSANATVLEQFFHKMFCGDKLYGEWFKVNPSMIVKICSYEVLDNQFSTFFPEIAKKSARELELESEIYLLKKVISRKDQELVEVTTDPTKRSNRAIKRDRDHMRWLCKHKEESLAQTDSPKLTS